MRSGRGPNEQRGATLRILHLETGRHVYGGALQVLFLVEGLQARGIENILAVAGGSAVAEAGRSRGLPVRTLPLAGEADIRFPFRFLRLIRETAPDLVHLHSRRGADTLGALGARWGRVPVVLTRRVDNPEPSWAIRGKYPLYQRVITISEAIRSVLLHQGLDGEKVRCIRSALDPTPFESPCDREAFRSAFGLEAGARTVGMAAQFIPRKGHDLLLRAVPAILRDHPSTRFLLFGRGPFHAEIRERVRKADLEGAVFFPGFRDDLPGILPCLDVLVHPAAMEGLGIILLQAGAAGIPVVASDAGGIPEAVAHGETGLLFPSGDARALATAVSDLLADTARARAMGEAGRIRIRRDFSVDRMVEGNLAIYKELLATHSST